VLNEIAPAGVAGFLPVASVGVFLCDACRGIAAMGELVKFFLSRPAIEGFLQAR
jgi:hypothetical protein